MRSKHLLIAVALVALGIGVGRLSAAVGTLDSPDVPGNTWSFTLEDIYNRLDTGAAGTQSTFTEPAAGPGTGTMHDLNQIMAQAPSLDNTNGATETNVLDGKTFWGLTGGQWGPQIGAIPTQTVSNTTVSQLAGYYDAFDLSVVDTDLVSPSIRSGVNIFGVDGDPMVVNTSSGDAVAADIVDGKKAWVDGAEVTGNIPTQTVDNTTVSQLAGYYDAFDLSLVDTHLVSPNIRSGVNIYGVDGHPMVVNTSLGTATASDILSDTVAWVDGAEVTGDVAAGSNVDGPEGDKTFNIPDGLYSGSKTCTANDSDLVAGNIKCGGTIFGVTGTILPECVAKTGQTGCWDSSGSSISCTGTGQDGEYQKGCPPVVAPSYGSSFGGYNRTSWLPCSAGFTDNGNGTVTDNLTGLMWAQNANLADLKTWAAALTYCNGLSLGGYSDWRLPNLNELRSLFDPGLGAPYVPQPPFTGVQSDSYWSSTTHAGDTDAAWGVTLDIGRVISSDKPHYGHYVWPVRGGQ